MHADPLANQAYLAVDIIGHGYHIGLQLGSAAGKPERNAGGQIVVDHTHIDHGGVVDQRPELVIFAPSAVLFCI